MLSWLWDCVVGKFCSHEYELIEDSEVKTGRGAIIGNYIVSRCPKCGKVITANPRVK